jgi:hypothetical protein
MSSSNHTCVYMETDVMGIVTWVVETTVAAG